MTRLHLDRRNESLWRRACRELDCHPVMLGILLVCMGYVAILVAWCVRHAATGAW
jgi:hypothetical protein